MKVHMKHNNIVGRKTADMRRDMDRKRERERERESTTKSWEVDGRGALIFTSALPRECSIVQIESRTTRYTLNLCICVFTCAFVCLRVSEVWSIRYEFRRTRHCHTDVRRWYADIIGSNASRQTIREISYRIVAALALLSWQPIPGMLLTLVSTLN